MIHKMVCDFERHNISLNSNKTTAPLHSTAATSPDIAVASVAFALLPIGGLACHPSQWTIQHNCQFHFAFGLVCCFTNRTTEYS